MADFTPVALQHIKALGTTHIWYTGLLEHGTKTDYSAYGIQQDQHGVIKGQAGSAYAVKDYYDIDPDLAVSVPARMHEFRTLVKNTHDAGMKMIMDFVPNHVARQYHSDQAPEGVTDFGAGDDRSKHFDPNNNFYYFPGEDLKSDGFDLQGYHEFPARATGNDNFSAWAHQNDWYETVKLNYGVDYTGGGHHHFEPTPNTWHRMLHILLYWAEKGVDGFRCDMAEMVPVEFWSWAIPQVKLKYPDVIFIAEVYNPDSYRSYIHCGHFDYLYDKVGMYDTLRNVTCGWQQASDITQCWQRVDDIKDHMLYFLENHDEQRLASDFFAGSAEAGRAAMVVAACMGTNPMMIYFGQELGERGMDSEGFSGRDGRTTIFDYWSVDTIRRWRNNGRFDGRQLTPNEVYLQHFYSRLLTICNTEDALREGEFYDLAYVNPRREHFNPARHYAFLRRLENTVILVVANFADEDEEMEINIPSHVFEYYDVEEEDSITAQGLLTGSPYHISFNTTQPTRLLVPAQQGRLLKMELKKRSK